MVQHLIANVLNKLAELDSKAIDRLAFSYVPCNPELANVFGDYCVQINGVPHVCPLGFLNTILGMHGDPEVIASGSFDANGKWQLSHFDVAYVHEIDKNGEVVDFSLTEPENDLDSNRGTEKDQVNEETNVIETA